ncbi:MAG: hypothetical protein ACTSWC_08600, partial [Promethearchaeota archaeon]
VHSHGCFQAPIFWIGVAMSPTRPLKGWLIKMRVYQEAYFCRTERKKRKKTELNTGKYYLLFPRYYSNS